MADGQPPLMQQDPVAGLLSEFGTRLNELEEKQRLLKDRTLLIGENLISTKEDFEKDIFDLKKQINNIDLQIKTLNQLNERILNELSNLARKSELEILQRQMKMFEPLQLARIKDVKDMITDEIKKSNKK